MGVVRDMSGTRLETGSRYEVGTPAMQWGMSYQRKWAKALLASAILCVSSRFLTAAPRCSEASSSSPARRFSMPCRSEEHTSELQSLMRISYSVFCLKKITELTNNIYHRPIKPSNNNYLIISLLTTVINEIIYLLV